MVKHEVDPPNKSGEKCPARQTHCVGRRVHFSPIYLVCTSKRLLPASFHDTQRDQNHGHDDDFYHF